MIILTLSGVVTREMRGPSIHLSRKDARTIPMLGDYWVARTSRAMTGRAPSFSLRRRDLGNDGLRRGLGIARREDRSADDEIIGAGRNRLRGRRRPLLVAARACQRPDARCDQQHV